MAFAANQPNQPNHPERSERSEQPDQQEEYMAGRLIEAQLQLTLYVNEDGTRGVLVTSAAGPAPDAFVLLGMLGAASAAVGKNLS